jgi:hypothetical protein
MERSRVQRPILKIAHAGLGRMVATLTVTLTVAETQTPPKFGRTPSIITTIGRCQARRAWKVTEILTLAPLPLLSPPAPAPHHTTPLLQVRCSPNEVPRR